MRNYDIQELFTSSLKLDVSTAGVYKDAIDTIVSSGEKNKAVLTVIITGLVYKHYHPGQRCKDTSGEPV